jgi:hypothetical protein
MKYVILKAVLAEGIEKVFPFIFSEHLTHRDVAELMQMQVMREVKCKDVEIVGAGFIDLEHFYLHGDSESLKIKNTIDSRHADHSDILMHHYGMVSPRSTR